MSTIAHLVNQTLEGVPIVGEIGGGPEYELKFVIDPAGEAWNSLCGLLKGIYPYHLEQVYTVLENGREERYRCVKTPYSLEVDGTYSTAGVVYIYETKDSSNGGVIESPARIICAEEFASVTESGYLHNAIRKDRYVIKLPIVGVSEGATTVDTTELFLELDFFKGPLKDLVLAEIEFCSKEEMQDFDPTTVFGDLIIVEVTDDKRFKNKNLCKLNSEELDKILTELVGLS